MATDRQISQLVLQVDANVAVAQRSLQDLARVVNQSTASMNTSLAANDAAIGRTLTAHHSVGLAYNNARIAQTELTAAVTRSIDAYGAGASPLRILSTEMGRLTEAASFLGGSAGNGMLGTIVRFIGGPWGIAMLLAGSIIAKLVTKHLEGAKSVEELVQKMRLHAVEAANSKTADEQWAKSIDGLIDRNVKLTEEIKKRLKAEEDLDDQTLRQALRDHEAAERAAKDAQTRITNLQRQLVIAKAANSIPNAPGAVVATTNTGAIQQLENELARAKSDLAKAKTALGQTQDAVVQNTIAVGEAQGKAMVDSSAAVELWAKRYIEALHNIENANKGALAGAVPLISSGFNALKKAFDDAASAGVGGSALSNVTHQAALLGNQLRDGKIVPLQYAAAMRELARQLEAVAEAAKNAKKGTGEFGKEVSFADAAAIARGAGLKVTSGYRSTAHQAELYNDPAYNHPGNPVARPGTSAHEGVNGKWALDIAFAPGLTAEKLRKLYGGQGVSLSAVYKESGHFHIEGSRSQAAAEEAAAKRAEIAGIRDQGAFARQGDQLDAEIDAAKKQLLTGYDTQAHFAEKEIDAQAKKLRDSIAEQVALGKATNYAQGITAAQGKILTAKVEELGVAKKAVIEQRKTIHALEEAGKTRDQLFGFQVGDLQFADEMAKTQADHRRLQLQILDIAYQQKEYDLKNLLATQQLAGEREAAARTQAEINRLPTERAQDQARTLQRTQGPLDSYLSGLPRTAPQVNEQLQGIEVSGLEHAVEVLAEFRHGWAAMRNAALHALDDISGRLIKLGLDRLVGKLFKVSTATTGGQQAALATAGSSLGVAGATLNTAGATLTTSAGLWQVVAAQLQAAAAALSAAGATAGATGGGGGLGGGAGLFGSLLGGLGGGGGDAAWSFGASGGYDAVNAGLVGGLAGGGWREIGGFGGIDNNLLSINGVPLARVSRGETLAVIPSAIPRRLPAANSNRPGSGDTFHIHLVTPNSGDPVRDRRTSLQQAADVRRAVAGASRKGLA